MVRSNGEVWLLGAGAHIFDGENWTIHDKIVIPKSGKEKKIIGLSYAWEDDTQTIWLRTKMKGMIQVKDNDWKLIGKKWKGSPYLKYSLKDSKGNFWACLQEFEFKLKGISYTKGQLCKFNGEEWIDYSLKVGGAHPKTRYTSKTYYTSLLEDNEGNIWIGTASDGAFKYDGKNWEVIKKRSGALPNNWVKFIKRDSRGNIWIGTDEGLSRFMDGQWKTFTREDGFPAKKVYFLWEDQDNNFWAFTATKETNVYKGLCRLEGDKWINQNEDNGLISYVTSIANFGDGEIGVCGTDGVSVFDGSAWTKYAQAEGIETGTYRNLYKDSKNNIWAYSDHTVIRFDGTQWVSYKEVNTEGEFWKIKFLKEDSNGIIWVGTIKDGVHAFDGSKWTQYSETNGLLDNEVKFLFEDKSKNIWVVTKTGTSVYYSGLEQ